MADTRRSASDNIFTVLVFIAALTLAFGVGYVWWRYSVVFGGLPFTAKAGAMLETLPALLA